MENKTFRRFLLLVICALCLSPMFFSCKLSDEALMRKVHERGLIKERDTGWTTIDTTRREGPLRIDTMWIAVDVPGPVQWIANPCANLCDSNGKLKPFVKKQHLNGITTTISTVGDSLKFEARADSLMQVNEQKDIYIETLIQSYKEKFIELFRGCEHKATGLDKFCYICTVFLFGCFFVVTLFFIFRKK